MGETNWIPGLVVLGGGLLAGAIAALKLARGGAPASSEAAPESLETADLELRDLHAERDAVLAQLRELDDTASKREAAQLARDRYALELQLAKVLMRLDETVAAQQPATPQPVAPAPAPAGFFASRPGLTGALWGGAVVAFLFGIYLMVQSAATARTDGMSITGNSDPAGAGPAAGPMQAREDFTLDGLRRRASARPGDAEAQLDYVQALLFEDQLSEAFTTTARILESDPTNARALTYQAIIRRSMGLMTQARQMLERAVALDPMQPEAWLQRGVLAFETARYDTAVESFERVLQLRPDGRDAIGPVLEQARALAGR